MTADAAAFWDRMAGRYARMKVTDPAAWEATLDRTRAHLQPADRVLEIGCGTGATAVRLAPAVAEYRATDLSERMIAIARARPEAAALPQLSFAVAGAAEGDGPVDAVLAFNLLHLLPDLPAALATIRDRLRPGGLFVSKTPCLAELSGLLRVAVPVLRAVGLAPRLTFLRRDGLEAAIAAAGFAILETADQPARRAQRLVIARRS